MLMAKPGSQHNWITFAMASFMNKDYAGTLNCVESMFKFEVEKPTLKPNEKNALRILQVRCHVKSGDYQNALQILDKNESEVLDKLKYYEL